MNLKNARLLRQYARSWEKDAGLDSYKYPISFDQETMDSLAEVFSGSNAAEKRGLANIIRSGFPEKFERRNTRRALRMFANRERQYFARNP